MSFTTEDLVMQEEVCTDLAPLEVTEDRAEVSSYVSLTPPLVSTLYSLHAEQFIGFLNLLGK